MGSADVDRKVVVLSEGLEAACMWAGDGLPLGQIVLRFSCTATGVMYFDMFLKRSLAIAF
jgi:hypothetical protein